MLCKCVLAAFFQLQKVILKWVSEQLLTVLKFYTMVSCVETNPPFEFLCVVIHLMQDRASGNLSCKIRVRALYAVTSTPRDVLSSSVVLYMIVNILIMSS